MSLSQHQYHAPIHHAPIHASVRSNDAQAIMLIQSALPTLQRIQAEFPWLLSATPATLGPSRVLAMLDNSVRYKPVNQRAQVQLDVMALRQVDQSLRALGNHAAIAARGHPAVNAL